MTIQRLAQRFVAASVLPLTSLSGMLLGGACVAQAEGPFHLTAKWQVGGDGGWDYLTVDPVSRLLYITRGNHVMVVDTHSGKQVADITGLHGTHGVAFDTDGKTGYISDGGGNQVAIFDRKTNQIVKTVPAGTNPDGIAFEPVTHTVWAFNGRSHNATVIDAKSQTVAATVDLPGKPEFPVADGRGSIFVNIEDTSEIVHLDARSHTAVATWPLAPCESPSGLAIDRSTHRLFPVCDNKRMAVVNSQTGKVVATPTIGEGPDASAFLPASKYAFSSNGGSGTLTVIREDAPDQYTVVQDLDTQKGARTMALDPDGKRVYVVTAQFGPRPAPTADNPRPRPSLVPGSFVILVASR
ncbi:MAG TPA: YncE family protein [Acidobacteriaceae bacterium]|nr:YncE family protein [Acidobacteriaceae bacterium]